MTTRHAWSFLLSLLLAGPALARPRCDNPQSPEALGIDVSMQDRCDPLVPEQCLLPLPNDYFTVRRDTKTGRKVAFVQDALPANVGGTHMNPDELNRLDGFSPGSALLLWMPAADLVRSGAPPITDIERSLADDSPIVVIDTRSGRRWPVWAEMDSNSPAGQQALVIRPATNFLEGHRYVVGVRGIVDGTGTPLAASPAFLAYRQGLCTTDVRFESRRGRMERIMKTLQRAGVTREDLQIAWEFTIGSAQSLAGRLLAIR